MLNVISYPTGKCFLNKLPEFVMTAASSVRMSIWTPSPRVPVFEGRYHPDFDGKITVDVSDIVRDYLKTTMPSGDSDLFQSGFEASFIFKMDEDNDGGDFADEFTVVNASPVTNLSLEDWCASHFLSNQPIQKPTNYESPEWLTYYDYVGDWLVVGRFYPKEGGLVDMVVKWDEKPGCWSVNVNYARLIPHVARLPYQLKGFYDIILYDGSMNEQCRQRYIYEERSAKEHYYLLANSLGGIDTLIARGENILQPELELNIGRFGKRFKPLDDTEDMRQWQQDTGMMPHRWRNWLYDILSNKQCAAKFDPNTGIYHGIVVTASEIGMSDNGQLANATFGYIMDHPANLIAEEGNTLTQSAAASSEPLTDLTTEAVVTLEQGASQPVTVNSERVYVSFGTSTQQEEVVYYINGVDAGSFKPAQETSPFVIEIPYGAEISFATAGNIKALTLNWYEGWHDHFIYNWSDPQCIETPDTYTFGWSEQVCTEADLRFTFAWKEERCVQLADAYAFRWSEDRCVLDAGGWNFTWKEERCVQEYIYKLIWEEIEEQEEENEGQEEENEN